MERRRAVHAAGQRLEPGQLFMLTSASREGPASQGSIEGPQGAPAPRSAAIGGGGGGSLGGGRAAAAEVPWPASSEGASGATCLAPRPRMTASVWMSCRWVMHSLPNCCGARPALLQGRPVTPASVLLLSLLQYLHGILLKNPVVTDANRDTVVEALRSIAELVIW